MQKQSVQNRSDDTLLVTMALPYANNTIHLGHLVEAVQTDMYVRFSKLTGTRTIYVCADDTHGTPIELNALRQGITPQQLVDDIWKSHVRDYTDFSIDFDIFYTTNSPENRRWAESIYAALNEKKLVQEREIEQYYCDSCHRFLPDRFIVGICPRCKAQNQYGDVCEVCGSTYNPTDLAEPKCIICSHMPTLKKSSHFFVQLSQKEAFLREYLNKPGVLQEDMRNFVLHWIDQGLREWCISRDGPYFGFGIPGTVNKYFYVWLDAPIGYISSTDKWCSENEQAVESIWGFDAPSRIVHFMGKDIVYFHTLFWPVMLQAANLKLPSSYYVHGFLTINGEKMSKSRGTFIMAREYLERVNHPSAAQYLRFYFASKLSNHSGDIDFLVDEFCAKVNTILINNIGNLHNRTFVFIERFFNGIVPDSVWDESLEKNVMTLCKEIEEHFRQVEFKSAIEKIQTLGSLGNKYYQDSKPWEQVKTNPSAAAVTMITCANIVKACAVFLKPVIPLLIKELEKQLDMELSISDCHFSLAGKKLGKVEKIFAPLEQEHVASLFLLGAKAQEPIALRQDKKQEPEVPQVEIADFSKIQLRVGVVKGAERVPQSEKLLKLSVQTGDGLRQIVSGIGKSYTPEQLIDRQIIYIHNLKPAKIMGNRSEGMLLTAQDGNKLVLLQPDEQVSAGAVVG